VGLNGLGGGLPFINGGTAERVLRWTQNTSSEGTGGAGRKRERCFNANDGVKENIETILSRESEESQSGDRLGICCGAREKTNLFSKGGGTKKNRVRDF